MILFSSSNNNKLTLDYSYIQLILPVLSLFISSRSSVIGLSSAAPIDVCTFSSLTITDQTWIPFIEKMVNCLELAVSVDKMDRYDLLISLAEELSEAAFQHSDNQYDSRSVMNMLPSSIPNGLHDKLSGILNKHMKSGKELMRAARKF